MSSLILAFPQILVMLLLSDILGDIMIQILSIIFGLFAISRSSLTIFRQRKVEGQLAKWLGLALVVTGILGFFVPGITALSCLSVVMIGFIFARPPTDEKAKISLVEDSKRKNDDA